MKKISANVLKIIAIISMLIDHFGYYFYYNIPIELYTICRIVGRIAMPVFAFLIVEGYLHTRSIKKYLGRLTILAITTQIVLSLCRYFSLILNSSYVNTVYTFLNVIFSFVLSIIILVMLDEKTKLFKNKIIDYLVKTLIVLLIILIYFNIKIDYNLIIPAMIVSIFFVKKYIKNKSIMVNKLLLSSCILIPCIFEGTMGIFSIFSLPFILLYNNTLGKKSVFLRNFFYVIFPVQHILMYVIAILVNK